MDPPQYPYKKRRFGIRQIPPLEHKISTAEDYEEKYPADKPGTELGENSRVWQVYHDEATLYDLRLVERWKDTIDVLLVFAGLFSAVVTTFVVQTFQNLQPDYGQITAALLLEQINFQRAGSGASALAPDISISLDFESDVVDIWVNALWFVSLVLSLATALLCVLIKEWLQQYINNPVVRPSLRAQMRQFRFMGLQKWNVPVIVGLLPQLLSASLFFYFAGLSAFLFRIHYTIAVTVTVLSISLLFFYLTSSMLPVYDPQCPFRTPLIYVWYSIVRNIHLSHQYITDNVYRAPNPPKTFRDLELDTVTKKGPSLQAEALLWLYKSVNSNDNASISDITLQSLSALYPNRPLEWLDDLHLKAVLADNGLHKQLAKEFHSRARDEQAVALAQDPVVERLERACRAFLTEIKSVPMNDQAYTVCSMVVVLLERVDEIREAIRYPTQGDAKSDQRNEAERKVERTIPSAPIPPLELHPSPTNMHDRSGLRKRNHPASSPVLPSQSSPKRGARNRVRSSSLSV